MSNLRDAAELALKVLFIGTNEVVPDNYDKMVGEAIRRLEMVFSESSKLEWFPAPTKTEWGEGMVCAMVNIDDNSYFDVCCEEWQKENVELMLGVKKREWVGLTEDETDGLIHSATYMEETDIWHLVSLVEERLKEKNT
jgi:hypothetical protein